MSINIHCEFSYYLQFLNISIITKCRTAEPYVTTGQQCQTSRLRPVLGYSLSLRVGLVVGWGWAFIRVELIDIVKGRVSGWRGICNRQHHPNFWSDAAGLSSADLS